MLTKDIIQIRGNEMTLNFSAPWDEAKYSRFIQSKKLPECNIDYNWQTDTYHITAPARFAHLFDLYPDDIKSGFIAPASHLWDYQSFISRIALKSKRFAVWADTGLGKTHILLEFARQVRHKAGKTLIITKPDLIDQTIEEIEKFNPSEQFELKRIHNRDELKSWCVDGASDIGITNYQKFIPRDGIETISECHHLAGMILDEASILKSGGGKIKWAIIKSARGIEYKLSCTATPAPNDTMEYASQGSFLEKIRSDGEVIWKYFIRGKDGEWKIREYARDAFYRFMAGWSIYLRNPKNYGFGDNLKDLPAPIIMEHKISITDHQRKKIMAQPDQKGQLSLFAKAGTKKLSMVDRSKYSEMAKGFIYHGAAPKRTVEIIESDKPHFVAKTAMEEAAAGRKTIIWTVFDEESSIIKHLINTQSLRVDMLSGKTPKQKRAGVIRNFKKGEIDILISKASLIGFGQNFQVCRAMIFSGFNDSFEQYYQAIRRAYRYGQTHRVRIHIPFIPELEGAVLDNIKRKEQQFVYDITIQERNYFSVMKEEMSNV